MENIVSINRLNGMAVLSRASGNALGQISDVFVDPLKGIMLGLIVRNTDNEIKAVEYKDIYSFGQDAVMTRTDEAVKNFDEKRQNAQPFAKRNLFGTHIFTESGKEIGQIANVLIHLAAPPFLIYEIRESLFDKLLGRNLYILAETGRAFSDDSRRIVVADGFSDKSASSLEEIAARKKTSLQGETQSPEEKFTGKAVIVRTRGEEETEISGREQETIISERNTNETGTIAFD